MIILEFENQLPEKVPSNLMVYSVKKFKINKDYAINIIKKLGLKSEFRGAKWKKIDNWTFIIGKKCQLDINHSSGSFRFKVDMDDNQSKVPFTINEGSLEFIAQDFMRTTNLIEEENQPFETNKISYLHERSQDIGSDSVEERIVDARVIFGRKIDGVNVRGVGGFVAITIAANESVIGGQCIWRPLNEKIQSVKIKKPEYAIVELKRRLQAQKIEGKIRILKADFCYFEMGQSAEQNFFEPTYAFVYVSRTNNFTYKSIEVIPAFDNPRENWFNRKDKI